MEAIPIDGLTLLFDAEEKDAIQLIGEACKQSIHLIHKHLGLDTPKDCRVYVMTSWYQFFFQSAPLHYRILLILLLPILYFRIKKTWEFAGGWAQPYGKRRTVGVKPLHLIEKADLSLGGRIFIPTENKNEKVQHVTCHELVHAFTSHLRLPMWLNEGLAMSMVDKLAHKPTVKDETLSYLTQLPDKKDPGSYRKTRIKNKDALVYQTVRGYWLTRYLEDTQPELLRSILAQRFSHKVIEERVATALGMSPEKFWETIDGVLVSYFPREDCIA